MARIGKTRGPVVHLERREKARAIEAILADFVGRDIEGFRILDIGSGNGGISEYFAQNNQVESVDVEDKRSDETKLNGVAAFTVVDSEALPFDDNQFDIVLSHHVIEHVSDHKRHLSEISRVTKKQGFAYLATPNKSSPVMEGHVGNDMVLRWPEMVPLFEEMGFKVSEYGWKVVRSPRQFHAEFAFGRFLPTPLVRLLRRFFPSHMFIIEPQ